MIFLSLCLDPDFFNFLICLIYIYNFTFTFFAILAKNIENCVSKKAVILVHLNFYVFFFQYVIEGTLTLKFAGTKKPTSNTH